jgi:VanZ family protein
VSGNSSSLTGRLIRYGPIVVWIGVIFFFSTGEASAAQTSRIIRPILQFFFPAAPEETLALYHGYIRKFAHFAEYAVLALLAARAFRASSARSIGKYALLLSVVLVLVVASVDELNQSFDPSRTGSAWDVGLDLFGGIAAALAAYLISRRYAGRS